MCGIYGEICLNDNGQLNPSHERHLAILHHRGPDESGFWENQSVFVGMCRLSIIDLAGGQQPIWNEDKSCCIVFNGELYNFLDLRPELETKGHVFSTNADTEVILHAYEEWGIDCLERLNGMFALAIWDGNRQRLFLARDRIGEKPLYYYRDANRLVFGSEIKAILGDKSIPRAVNPRGMVNYLTFGYAMAPETMYQNIFKLLPGHYMVVEGGEVHTAEYWDVGYEPQILETALITESNLVERLQFLLDDSVRRRMIADVPVGAFLSGGVDSSTVVALMTRHATDSVKTFSIGFDYGEAFNELPDARQTADVLGVEHHEIFVQDIDLVGTLQKLVYHYDEPFGDAAGFPLYLLSNYARQYVKVVLSGDGGDELFGGYSRYANEQFAVRFQRFPELLTKNLAGAMVKNIQPLKRYKPILNKLSINDPVRRYISWLSVFTHEMQGELLEGDVNDLLNGYDPHVPFHGHFSNLNGMSASDHLNRLMYIDVKTRLVDSFMEKTDKATMACSLEARLPLLDHRIVELAFQIPSKYKVRGQSNKRIFKKAISNLVPHHVLNKPKRGFAVPKAPWFQGELKDFTFEVLFDDHTVHRGYFQPAFVEKMWQDHIEGAHNWGSQLWLLLNFELWHRTYLDG